MVPKVAGKGRSFKGAGLYYLHDKKALTSERVAFAQTVNLPTADPEKAMGWMAHTALRQAEIKAAAGGVAKGRKLRDPVYAYSLSWSPDEQPTREQMLAAGMETLKRLGLDGHEAVLIAHKDEPHPHLHVIVNRVNPETGIAAPLSNDHLKLSAWAEEYERAQGKIRCEQRVENNALRKDKQFVKDRRSQNAAEFHRWRKARLEADYTRREQEAKALAARHARERDDLKAWRDETIAARRQEAKAAQKPLWAALYKMQRDEKRAFEQAQKTTFGRLRYWLTNRHLDRWGGESRDRQGMLARAFQVVVNREIMEQALAAKHEADRKALAHQVKEDTKRRLSSVYKAHDKVAAEARQEQAQERAALAQKHSRESQEAARRIKQGQDRAAFDFEKARQQSPAPAPADPATTLRDIFAAVKDGPKTLRDRIAEDAAKPFQAKPGIEDGEAARMIREARKRGLDESRTTEEGRKDEGRAGDGRGEEGGGQVFRAFRDAEEGRAVPPRDNAGAEDQAGGQAFRAFRDAQERQGPFRDDSGDDRDSSEGRSVFNAFRDAQERQGPFRDDSGDDRDSSEGRSVFRAFRDAQDDRKDKDRDQDDKGRGPTPPGRPGRER